MKAIKYIFVGIMAAFLFAGCAGNQVKVPGVDSREILISKEKGVYEYQWNNNPIKDYSSARKYFKRMLNVAAKEGLRNGYSYMALVNNGFNNLTGYPINSWRALDKYLSIHRKAHFRPSWAKSIVNRRYPKIKVVYLKKRPKGLFVWNLRKLKSDTM